QLVVAGTNFSDELGVGIEGSTIVVYEGGRLTATYQTSEVANIWVDAFRGNDSIVISRGLKLRTTLIGGDGDDLIAGGNGTDSILGGAGNDRSNGNSRGDYIYGGLGNDIIQGQGGSDVIYGQEGEDLIDGGDGNDYLDGGAGNDDLY